MQLIISVRTGNLCSLAPLIKSDMELVLSYPVETTDTDPGIIGVIIAAVTVVIIAGVLGGLGLVLLAVCCYHKRKSKYEVNSTDTQMSSLILIVMA